MAKQILQADDIDINMFVTIHTAKMKEISRNTSEGWQNYNKEEEHILKGKPLQIVAIDFPYIIVKYGIYNPKFAWCQTTLDLREIKIMELTHAYVVIAERHFKDIIKILPQSHKIKLEVVEDIYSNTDTIK